MQDFEILGSFYLGKEYDVASGRRTDNLVLYDSKDLVTHAVCVGMTGSGKTGLCIGLLEEAAIDGIPAIIIDPKGDLANLCLTFPNLSAQEFRPWVNESDARTKGLSIDDYARQQAEEWKKGLESWGQNTQRIARFRDSCQVVVYTPASNAGIPLSIMRSFDCPPFEVMDDAELLRERISTTAGGLLGLAGVRSDPMRGREHILLSSILQNAWQAGRNLDLESIITLVQNPGFQKVGVLDLESFFPGKDRFELAMTLNNLLASPHFSAWNQGEAIDISRMLHTDTGKPRLAIVSIAHLDDAQRMFFVSMLLSHVLGWVRSQSGTSSLRAILYMDEIAGYVPPIANPPSKLPLLTLMKQARAYGLGIVLATQNPVDIDYKGLSNAGTWFVGRLQTEQDKARLLDGLEGAMSGASRVFDRAATDRTLSSLGKRVFLMNNVHESAPVVFETRWVLSYLRGPLTRQQIKTLMDPFRTGVATGTPAAAPVVPQPVTATPPAAAPASSAASRPTLPPDVPQYFLPVRGTGGSGATLVYKPLLLGLAKVQYSDSKLGVNADERVSLLAPIGDGPVPVDWDRAVSSDLSDRDVLKDPSPGATFEHPHPLCTRARSYTEWTRDCADAIVRSHSLTLYKNAALGEVSRPGESEKDFRVRLAQTAREQRDAFAEKLRAKYAPKIATLENRIRLAEQKVEVQKSQATSAKLNTALSIGSAILGGFLGRKAISTGTVGKAATAARAGGRAVHEAGDVKRAEENVDALRQQLADLQAQFQSEVDAAAAKVDGASETLETLTLKPRKTNINVQAVVLAWTPHWRTASGDAPAWE